MIAFKSMTDTLMQEEAGLRLRKEKFCKPKMVADKILRQKSVCLVRKSR